MAAKLIEKGVTWSVYIILCSDNSLYTGISTDVQRRFDQHARLQGAKYFRFCQPVRIVYLEMGLSRASASQREAAIKKMKITDKYQLINRFVKSEKIPDKCETSN